MLLEVVGAEQDPRHVDGVLRALRVRDRAHERLVRVPHVRVDHVVVPLVHRAGRPARTRCRPSGAGTASRTRASRSSGSPRSCRSGVRRRGRARTASRSAGASTVALPPISTLFAGLRACWVNSRGAVACTSCAAHPAGEPHALAVDVGAGRLRTARARRARRWKSIPTCSRIVSALSSMSLEPFLRQHLERRAACA